MAEELSNITLANLVSFYEMHRAKRLKLDKESAEEKKLEEKYKASVIKWLEDNKKTGVVTEGRYVEIVVDDKPIVTDWGKLYDFIKQHGAFDLLQKRITESAVELRWADDVAIPGVSTFPVTKLSIRNA